MGGCTHSGQEKFLGIGFNGTEIIICIDRLNIFKEDCVEMSRCSVSGDFNCFREQNVTFRCQVVNNLIGGAVLFL